ncbi:MAG TPA: beta-propeller fold lactonase family protein, partial [Dongiaceae bacterium]|nr:beta-propeller fold lactonase family protein [Dongiaceae bacterium]
PQFAAVDPSNTHLYIPNFTDNTISAFTINGDGSLTAVTGSPFSTGVGSGPEYIAVEATGKFLYVSNANDNTISALTIGSGGALGAAVAGSPFSTGATPVGIAIDPSNATLAVANLFGNSVSLFSLNSTSGVLTPAPLPLIEASANPFFINYGLGTTALSSPVGAVFAANAVSGDISAFTSTSSTGVLTAAGSPVTGVPGNNFANADLRGHLLFVGGGTQVEGFAIDQTGGALTKLMGSPLSVTGTDTGSAVYVTPTEQFAYVLDSTSGSLVQNRVDVFAGTVTGPGTSTPAFTGASNLAADTQGDFIYVLGQNATNGIQPFTTYTTTGGINASTQSPALPGNWTSGSVDATGQYFVAVDSTAKTLQSFSITPAGTGSGSDGSLTPIGGAVTLPGTGPWVVTFDPLDRAVFVADQTLGTVLPFAFDLSTGTIGLAGTTTNVSANGVTQINADATGSYLYVGVAAASAPGSTGGISIYTIGAGGSLTAVPGSPFTTGTGNPAIANTNNVQ